ncbi:TVP38/TMEM64 family protein [Agaribacter flavus]|uniref:TVP38/TMEM64 family protein n=1 Tax=Agaribacter flavus TaxID=1902781 RepID=A0ABV7FPD5_9ALTE
MKSLLKAMLALALCFASTFVLLNFSGLVTVEKIESWLAHAQTVNPIFVASLVSFLLFIDLFIAMPTLTVMIIGGYFLGWQLGAFSAISGILLAGICGYGLSAKYGDRIIALIIKDPLKRTEVTKTYQQHGPVIILLSRAVPILPEVSACMAGMTKMPFGKFLVFWLISTVPYGLIATYAGSISTLENPKPAILAAVGLTSAAWFGWFMFKQLNRQK